MEKDDLITTRMSHFVGIGLVLAFLLPHSSTPLLLVNPLLCLLYKCFRQNKGFYKYNWIVLLPIILTLLVNLPQDVSSKTLMSCFAILLYFFCFPMVGKVKIPNAYFYVILGFILATQLAYALNIRFFENILDTYYPISEDDKAALHEQNTVDADNMMDYRLGGLYHNSNQCAKYLSFLLAAFIILNSDKPFRRLLPFIAVDYYAILLTGSRTGFVVASLIVIAYLFVDKKLSVVWRYGATLSAVLVFMYLIFIGSDIFRGFNVFDTGSTDLKQATFGYYLSTENSIIRLLLGYLDTSKFDHSEATMYVMDSFDSDYGSIIFSYGFMGFAAILLLYFTIFLTMKREGRVFFVLLLWMYSSTIVKSFRALFIFTLLLSIIYCCNKKKNKTSLS